MTVREGVTLIHLVEREGDTVMPLCRDWTHATNWTTIAAVASCPECLARFAQQATRPAQRARPRDR